MIEIKIIEKKNIEIENYEHSSDFFLSFFNKIDEFNLAEIFLLIGDNRLKIDFSFDLLSMYDFIHLLMRFIENEDVNNEFTLLLYERGSDKIVFKKNVSNTISISHFDDVNINNSQLTLSELKINILNCISKIDNLFSLFSYQEENYNHFQNWKSRIIDANPS